MSGRQNNFLAQALQQGALALQAQQFAQAEEIATSILKSNRTDRHAALLLAHALMGQKRGGEAIAPLERVARRADDGEIETLLGALYDPRFNPVDAATPVMLRMRPRLMAALQDGGAPDLLDWPTMLGYLAGRATRWISGFLAGFQTAERTAGTEPRPVPALPARSA